jgi:hypothetical protein
MHNHGTAVLDRPEAAPTSPAIGAGTWFERYDRPLTLRMELPLSAELMVAALYADDTITPDDLLTAEDVWGHAACALVEKGTAELEQLAAILPRQEKSGRLDAPEWLAFVRQRVAEVTGGAA